MAGLASLKVVTKEYISKIARDLSFGLLLFSPKLSHYMELISMESTDSARIPQIPLVIDTLINQDITAVALHFIYEHHELQAFRSRKQKLGRFKCKNCGQPANLHALADHLSLDGHAYHFQHEKNAAYCEWKSENKSKTKAEIYEGAKEGSRHLEMKHYIHDALTGFDGWQIISMDKQYVSSPETHKRTKPDLLAKYKGVEVAFEIQLRSESPDTLIQRQKIHHERGGHLVWVSAENIDMVPEENQASCLELKQVQKDIAHSNRGNILFFNSELAEESVEKGELCFLVKFYSPTLIGKSIHYSWEEAFVGYNELSFEDGDCFYFDFPKKQKEIEDTLRENGKASVLVELYNKRPHSFSEFLKLAKVAWPTFNKDNDLIWLNAEYSKYRQEGENKIRSKIYQLFSSQPWRYNQSVIWWDGLASKVYDMDFGISDSIDLRVIEKLYLIYGATFSDQLNPSKSSFIRACHFFYDQKSFQPYKHLCEKAIGASPYRNEIITASNMQERLVMDLNHIEPKHDIDRLYSWLFEEGASVIMQ